MARVAGTARFCCCSPIRVRYTDHHICSHSVYETCKREFNRICYSRIGCLDRFMEEPVNLTDFKSRKQKFNNKVSVKNRHTKYPDSLLETDLKQTRDKSKQNLYTNP